MTVMLSRTRLMSLLLLGFSLVLAFPRTATSQAQSTSQDPNARHTTAATNQNPDLQKQIEDLRQQLARLQTTLDQQSMKKSIHGPKMQNPPAAQTMPGGMSDDSMPPSDPPQNGPSAMGKMMDDDMDMNPMEDMDMNEMAKMGKRMGMAKRDSMGGSSMSKNKSMGGMDMMGKMNRMPATARNSTLPGVPGASHLYHIGATGFFLDHSDEVSLTPDQTTSLNGIKEKSLLEKNSTQLKIDQAEQELWALTGADQPDQSKIQSKLTEIEKLHSQQRMDFIHRVGDATQVLTPEQRQKLLGTMTSPGKK